MPKSRKSLPSAIKKKLGKPRGGSYELAESVNEFLSPKQEGAEKHRQVSKKENWTAGMTYKKLIPKTNKKR